MSVRSTGVAVGLTLGVFVIGALLMNFVVMPLVIHQRGSVIVPDVRGMSEQQATQLLQKMALEVRVERRRRYRKATWSRNGRDPTTRSKKDG
jgi:beta-lactam-binding protein with PASTA domain